MNCKTFEKQWMKNKGETLSSEALSHLATCNACRAKVERYRQALSLIKETPQIPDNTAKIQFAVMSRIRNLQPAANRTSHRKLWIASAAASVALLLAVAQITYHHVNDIREDEEAIVDMLSDMHAEQYSPRPNTSEYSDLAIIESYL